MLHKFYALYLLDFDYSGAISNLKLWITTPQNVIYVRNFNIHFQIRFKDRYDRDSCVWLQCESNFVAFSKNVAILLRDIPYMIRFIGWLDVCYTNDSMSNSSANLRWRQQVSGLWNEFSWHLFTIYQSEVIRCAGIEPWSEVIECETLVATVRFLLPRKWYDSVRWFG